MIRALVMELPPWLLCSPLPESPRPQMRERVGVEEGYQGESKPKFIHRDIV